MDYTDSKGLGSQLIKGAGAFLLVSGLALLERHWALMDQFSRWSLCLVIELFGVDCFWSKGVLNVGKLHVPWSDACSGINGLLLYWVVTIWTQDLRVFRKRALVGFLLAVPLALAANLGRVGFLVGYRTVMYPSVESMSLHYLVGFLFLLPGILVIRRLGGAVVEYDSLHMIYFSSVFSQLLILSETPGAEILVICTIVILLDNHYEKQGREWSALALAVWISSAVFITVASMESLWLPWLLLCPLYWNQPARMGWVKCICLLGTTSVIVMNQPFQLLVVGVLVYWGWAILKRDSVAFKQPIDRSVLSLASRVGFGLACIIPFAAPLTQDLAITESMLPGGTFSRQYGANSHEIRVVGQAPDLQLFSFQPDGGGRHHALKTCMGFRGVVLEHTQEAPEILHSEDTYYAEAFLLNGQLIRSYPGYLLHTALPFSQQGLHLVVAVPKRAVTVNYFRVASNDLLQRLASKYSEAANL